MKSKKNGGFTLTELIVSLVVFSVIFTPMITLFYFTKVGVEKQTEFVRESVISRGTMKQITDDLKTYGSLGTYVKTENDSVVDGVTIRGVTTLVILDDDTRSYAPKVLSYVYDPNSRMLIRKIDDVMTTMLTDEQLGDHYYTDEEKAIYTKEPVIFTEDAINNSISVYLRIKVNEDANIVEGSETFYLAEENDKVLQFKNNSYIQLNENEEFNFEKSSFTMEAWIKPTTVEGTQTIFDFGKDGGVASVLKLCLNDSNVSLKVGDNEIFRSDTTIPANQWTFVACIYNYVTKEVSLYVRKNGEEYISKDEKVVLYDTRGKLDEIEKAVIGNRCSLSGEDFVGDIYEPRIWSVVRSEYTLLEYSKNKLVGNENGLLVYLKGFYKQETNNDDNIIWKLRNDVNYMMATGKNVIINEEIPTERLYDNLDEVKNTEVKRPIPL